LSAFFAGNFHSAILQTADWVGVWLTFLLIGRILAGAGHGMRNIFLAALIALGALTAFKCLYQVWVEIPETISYFEQHRDEIIRQKGWEPEGGMIRAFEARLRGGDATGFFALGNATAACLNLFWLATLGHALWRFTSRRGAGDVLVAGMEAALVILMMAALVMTRSVGGIIAGVVGLGLFILGAVFHSFIREHKKSVGLILLALAALLAAGTLFYGLKYDRLPGRSLTFRWHYWKASWDMIVRHPWLGVGPGNFGSHYTRFKIPQAPEEVQSPHNIIVEIAANVGLPAAAIFILLLILVFRHVLVSHDSEADQSIRIQQERGPPSAGGAGKWILLLIAAVFIARGWSNGIWGLYTQSGGGAVAFYMTVTGVLLPACLFTLVLVLTGGARDNETGQWIIPIGDKVGLSPAVRLGIGCGLLVFLLHNMIEFSLLQPGGGTIFWAFAALAVIPSERSEKKIRKYLPATAALVVLFGSAVFAGLVVLPIYRAEELANRGRFVEAAERDPKNADRWLAAAKFHFKENRLQEALQAAERAVKYKPADHAGYELAAGILKNIAALEEKKEPLLKALDYMKLAIERYPTNPRLHMELGRLLDALGRAEQAEKEYRNAVELDAQIGKIDVETAGGGKLTPSQLRWMKHRIDLKTED
jgi:hypothetical protein